MKNSQKETAQIESGREEQAAGSGADSHSENCRGKCPEPTGRVSEFVPPDELTEKLRRASAELVYISETHADFSVFCGERTEIVSKTEVLRQTKNPPDAVAEEIDSADFFGRLTMLRDWYGTRQIENAGRFGELEKLLNENLKNLKVFKINEIQMDIYVLGLNSNNRLCGVKTKAVET